MLLAECLHDKLEVPLPAFLFLGLQPGKKPFYRPLAHRPNFSMSSRTHPSSAYRGPVATHLATSGAHYPVVRANSSWQMPSSQPPRNTQTSSPSRTKYPLNLVSYASKPRDQLPQVTRRPEASYTDLRPPSVIVAPKNARQTYEMSEYDTRASELTKTARQFSEPLAAVSRPSLQITSAVNRSKRSEWGPRKVSLNRPSNVREPQPYRPPTPPEMGSTASSYDSLSSTQEDLRIRLERMRLKAEQVSH